MRLADTKVPRKYVYYNNTVPTSSAGGGISVFSNLGDPALFRARVVRASTTNILTGQALRHCRRLGNLLRLLG